MWWFMRYWSHLESSQRKKRIFSYWGLLSNSLGSETIVNQKCKKKTLPCIEQKSKQTTLYYFMKQTREYLKLEFKIDDIDFIKEMVTVGENIFPIHWICSYIHLSLFRSRYQGGETKKTGLQYLWHLLDGQKAEN